MWDHSWRAYQLAKARMEDDWRQAERERLIREARSSRDSRQWLRSVTQIIDLWARGMKHAADRLHRRFPSTAQRTPGRMYSGSHSEVR
jgi:hypothetical protein